MAKLPYKPWILESERNGQSTLFDTRLGSLRSIGSGKPWAEAIFRPHLRTELDLELGKIFAYRIIDDSINLAASGLAKPIRVFTVSLNGDVEKIAESDLQRIAETRETWRELARETVGTLLAPRSREKREPEVPKPDKARGSLRLPHLILASLT